MPALLVQEGGNPMQPTKEQLIAHATEKLGRISVEAVPERYRLEARMNQQLLEIAIAALTGEYIQVFEKKD